MSLYQRLPQKGGEYPTSKKFKEITGGVIKTRLSDNFKNQCSYLCGKVPNLEWSGPCFYSIEGDIINHPESTTIVVHELYPMDIGTSSYTEYTPDGPLGGHLMKRVRNLAAKEDEKWHIGKVHSHNNMNVFHSSTDVDDLHNNAQYHNFYFSIIVNNRMEWDARIVTVIETVVSKEISKLYVTTGQRKASGEWLEKRSEHIPEIRSIDSRTKELLIYNCEVQAEESGNIPDWFKQRAAKILEANPRATAIDFNREEQGHDLEECEEFLKKLIMFDENYEGSIDNALNEAENWMHHAVNRETFTDSIQEMFTVVYESMFGDIDEVVHSTINSCMELLELKVNIYPITVKAVINGLENYVNYDTRQV